MSDRLNLNDVPDPCADINLSDHGSVEAAVHHFGNLPGPYKVYGPAERVADVMNRWRALSWIPMDKVSFRQNDGTRLQST